jgi:uncharacterized protein
MSQFRIHGQRHDGARATFIYDNMNSTLTDDMGIPISVTPINPQSYDGVPLAVPVSRDNPGRKTEPVTLKIQLGLLCNYECGYCSQRFVPHASQTGPAEVEVFLHTLKHLDTSRLERIEFWGGEPLVYWKTLKPLSAQLRRRFPSVTFVMITNGSLLDDEKNTWLDAMGFHVAISHDGPAQAARGPDPLDDPKARAGILDLYKRLHPQHRISINTMMHRGNTSRAAVVDFMRGVFGDDVPVGEGSVIDPYDEGGMAASFQDEHEHLTFRRLAYQEVMGYEFMTNMGVSSRVVEIVDSIANRRPALTLGQKCSMDRADNLAIDLKGDVLTCQNVSSAARAPNHKPHVLGNIGTLDAVRLDTATHWSHRPECMDCPVLQSCKGSCMFLEGQLFATGCNNAFSDHLPFFAAAIAHITGYVPRWIDGPQRASRKDIFGLVNGVPDKVKQKVIPIKAL